MVLYQAMLLKNLFVISLILLISISHFGYYFVCGYQQKKVRKEMKLRMLANINSTSLVVFEKALIDVKNLSKKPDDSVLLQLYGLYKQATEGDVTGERPGGFDFKGIAKFDAWASKKGIAKEQAMQDYVALMEKLHQNYA